MDKKFSVLIVDDEVINVQLISSSLSEEYNIYAALNGHDAISQLKRHIPDLILLDVVMPDISGFEVCKIIKANSEFEDIPVVFLTFLDSQEDILRGLEAGGIDYLTKPVNLDLLKLRVRNHIRTKERRERMEWTLRSERNLITNIMETSPVGISTVDSTGKITFANAKAVAILGLSKDEITQTTYNAPIWHISQIDGSQFPTERLPFNQVMSTGKAVSDVQHAIEWPDGRRIFLSINAAPIIDAENQVTGMVATIEDITDHRQAEEALVKSEERYRELFNSMVNGFALHEIILDESGIPCDYRFLAVNAAFERLTTLKAKDIIGRTILEIAPQTEHFWIDTYGRVALTGEACHFEHFSEVLGKHFEINAYTPQTGQFVCVFADITKRKQAEAEKSMLEAQLQQAHKMESIGRLAGGVAHDFNNMLTIILGHAQLGLMHLEPDHPVCSDFTEISRTAERSADLTRQLLAFARKQTIAPKILDLNETVSGMLKILQRLIGEDINLNWHPAPNLWPVKLDPSQIDQILANLCVNARDSIANVGKITIETGSSIIDEEYCTQNSGFMVGEYLRLSVSDNGCGMDKATQSQIFEPFFTTKGLGEGTGLGLATVYGIVRQNNGFINVYSEPGLGSTFTIYLPRYLGKVEQVMMEGAVEPVRRGKETILLVEDEPAILKITSMILKKQGYTVLAANTPSEAVRIASEHIDKIHLMMTDVVMPEMNGRDLAKKLQSLYPELKCLYMSGYTSNVIAHHGVLDEGVQFIQKPYSLPDLAAKVRNVLDD